MSEVNYIQHMNGLFIRLYEDDRINPYHISIYLALFNYWNLNRFKNPFSVARFEVMKLANVKSPNTYSKCLKELMKFGYIKYVSSNNPYKGSLFSLINFCTSTTSLNGQDMIQGNAKNGQALSGSSSNDAPALTNSDANNGQALIPSKTYKLNNKTRERENALSPDLINNFFLFEKSTKNEAQKFWNYYESNGWLIGGKTPMIDWQASARNWILRSKELNRKAPVQKTDYLHTNNKKRYDEPL